MEKLKQTGKGMIKKGDKIYVETSLYLSHGSDDFVGGVSTVSKVYEAISGGEKHTFIEIEERPGTGYNWSQFLSLKQDELKERFGEQKAHPDPSEDRPWAESGDIVNGEVYKDDPIW